MQRPWSALPAKIARVSSDTTAADPLSLCRQELASHIGIAIGDAEGRLTEANAYLCRSLGCNRSELLARSCELFYACDYVGSRRHEMWTALKDGTTWSGELHCNAWDGSMRWFSAVVVPTLSANGELERFVAMCADISNIRAQAEQATEQAETLRAMVDHFPGGVALINRDGDMIAYNRLYQTLLDLPENLFVQRPIKLERIVRFRAARGDYGSLPIDETVAGRINVLLSTIATAEERNERSGRTLEICAIPVPGGGHLHTYVDVTDNRSDKHKLQRMNSTLQAFVKHAPAAVAMFDKDMRYVAHTDRWLKDYNLPDESLIGRSHYDVFAEMPDHWKEQHKRSLDGAMESSPEELFQRADGTMNLIRWEVRPWHLEDNSIGGVMMLTEDIAERKRLEQELWRLAKQDSLTGLPNRLLFNERLEAMLATAAEKQQPFALGLVDVDRFKETNDILGHAAGDELLMEVASRLQDALLPYGWVARLGGDEFAVVISGGDNSCDADNALRAMFDAMKPGISIVGVSHRCSISLGLTYFPEDATSASELLKNADLALYRAKDEGRDRHAFYNAEMRTSFEATYKLRSDIQRALSRGELMLLYQPIVTFGGERVVSFEALLRWNDPSRGMLSPAQFDEIFDDPKCAADVGKWVLDQALRQAKRWELAGVAFERVAVNVTSADFALGTFGDYVASKLKETGMAPERLCVEVTERVFVGRGADGVATTLQRLHDMGVEIALDDFGTGFASLSHLKNLPIDRLKIDRSFVRDMETNPDNMAIVRSIAQLGQSLGLAVTVEGVEKDTQMTLLRAMGCATMQGYLFAKPMDGSRAVAFVSSRQAVSA